MSLTDLFQGVANVRELLIFSDVLFGNKQGKATVGWIDYIIPYITYTYIWSGSLHIKRNTYVQISRKSI